VCCPTYEDREDLTSASVRLTVLKRIVTTLVPLDWHTRGVQKKK
jgi:hypothetical protein